MSGLVAQHIRMEFGTHTAVSDAHFSVAEGEFVTLLGPSGCGKTTLLKIIAGFLAPSAGRILMGGVDVTVVPPEARDTAMCFQSYALFPHLDVRANLEFGLRQKRVAPAERSRRLDSVIAQLELGAHLAKLRDQVRIEIRRIQRTHGLTALYVTHDQAEALSMSDRIFVMNRGVIEQEAAPEVLYHQPRTAFVADFIGAANILPVLDQQPLAEGSLVRTPMGALTMAGTVTGPAIAWRPERARILPPGARAVNAFEARITDRAFVGDHIDLQVEINGLIQRLRLPHCPQAVGEVLRFALDLEDILPLEQGA
jgi:iron(III) transport system ATP-binding protein